MDLLCHINGDQDLLEAWLKYYEAMGVTTFHFIVHGRAAENRKLLDLRTTHPILIRDVYESEFRSEEKQVRINSVLPSLRGRWLLLVDSDEFVEFPYHTLSQTVRVLEFLGADALFAPMLQRLTADGSLETPERIEDPFAEFPLCSVNLCGRMGVDAYLPKYPLFRCGVESSLREGGNHHSPNGPAGHSSPLQGVTHHFKWRRTVLKRLADRANSGHTWRHQSHGYQEFLQRTRCRLPLEDSFSYSRAELFRRELLKRVTWMEAVPCAMRNHADSLPSPARDVLRGCYHTFLKLSHSVPQNTSE